MLGPPLVTHPAAQIDTTSTWAGMRQTDDFETNRRPWRLQSLAQSGWMARL